MDRRFTVRVVNARGMPADGLEVRVIAGDGRQAIAYGKTDAEGRAEMRLSDVEPDASLRLAVRNPATRSRVALSDPMPADGIPDIVEIALGARSAVPGTPPVSAAATTPPPARAEPAVRSQPGSNRRDAEKQAIKPEFARRMRNNQTGKALADRLLGKAPRKGRKSPAFIPAGTDVAAQVARTRQTGMSALQTKAHDLGGIVLRDTIAAESLKPGDKVPYERIDTMLPKGAQFPVRVSPVAAILEECAATHQAQALAGTLAGTAAAEPELAAAPPDEAMLAGMPLKDRIAAILDSGWPGTAARPTMADVAKGLRIEVPSGPADVDAYYDFHSLQVAWLDSWTALLDKEFGSKVRQLYNSIVEVIDPADIPGVSADFSEIDELYDLLETIEDSVFAASDSLAQASIAPDWVIDWSPEIADVWAYLTAKERSYAEAQYAIEAFLESPDYALEPIKSGYLDEFYVFDEFNQNWIPHETIGKAAADLADNPQTYVIRASDFIDFDRARDKQFGREEDYGSSAATALGRTERLLGELKEALVGPYQFDVFAEGSYNFGALAVYRQRWRPLGYQVGDLVSSIPLAPGEKRSYTINRKSVSSSSLKDELDRLTRRTSETAQTARAEGEINAAMERGLSGTSRVSGGGNLLGIVEINGGSEFSANQQGNSSQVRKDLSESTRKASQEYRDEHKVTMTTDRSNEYSFSENREISNPNNEITVTYLFYELQRRFEVSERFNDLIPVILVAFDMPQPHEITEAWLLGRDWIIEDALLDRSFLPALRYLRQSFAGDEVGVEILEQQWKAQLAIVADLRLQGAAHQAMRDVARAGLQDAVSESAETKLAELVDNDGGGIFKRVGEFLLSSKNATDEAMAENARSSLNWSEQDLDRIEATARDATSALEKATATYVAAVEARLNRRVQIDRLILHVKENILHYMQAIWMREHTDQRYLRLYDMEVQWPGPAVGTVVLMKEAVLDPAVLQPLGKPGQTPATKPPKAVKVDPPTFDETRKLYQVADLRTIMGWRGNLAMFRLTENNALSTFMAQDFLDSQFGLIDPDPLGELPTASEAIAIAQCAWDNPKTGETEKAEITEWLIGALAAAKQVSQDIVLPTGELFVEALPGAHALLEDFKLQHRAIDLAQAGAQLQRSQLDLLRIAMRLEADERDDPDIDRMVRIEGPASAVIDAEGT